METPAMRHAVLGLFPVVLSGLFPAGTATAKEKPNIILILALPRSRPPGSPDPCPAVPDVAANGSEALGGRSRW
jgi:hypothetical protein